MSSAMRCVLALALLGAVSGEWHGVDFIGKGKSKGKLTDKDKEQQSNGAVSGEWHDVEFIGKGKSKGKGKDKGKGKGKAVADLRAYELPEAGGKGKGKGIGKPSSAQVDEFHEAHVCHKHCGGDDKCHDKCPKPWDKLVEACHQLPQLKKCYADCNGREECLKTCVPFDLDWIQKMIGHSPDMLISRGERMCPEFEKRHACHQACAAGDFECHTRCHHEGLDWHRNHGDTEGESEHQWHQKADYASHYHGEHRWQKRTVGRSRHGEHDWHHYKHGDRKDDRSQEFQHELKVEQKGSLLYKAMKVLTVLYDNVMQMTSDLRSYHQSDGGGEVVV